MAAPWTANFNTNIKLYLNYKHKYMSRIKWQNIKFQKSTMRANHSLTHGKHLQSKIKLDPILNPEAHQRREQQIQTCKDQTTQKIFYLRGRRTSLWHTPSLKTRSSVWPLMWEGPDTCWMKLKDSVRTIKSAAKLLNPNPDAKSWKKLYIYSPFIKNISRKRTLQLLYYYISYYRITGRECVSSIVLLLVVKVEPVYSFN